MTSRVIHVCFRKQTHLHGHITRTTRFDCVDRPVGPYFSIYQRIFVSAVLGVSSCCICLAHSSPMPTLLIKVAQKAYFLVPYPVRRNQKLALCSNFDAEPLALAMVVTCKYILFATSFYLYIDERICKTIATILKKYN